MVPLMPTAVAAKARVRSHRERETVSAPLVPAVSNWLRHTGYVTDNFTGCKGKMKIFQKYTEKAAARGARQTWFPGDRLLALSGALASGRVAWTRAVAARIWEAFDARPKAPRRAGTRGGICSTLFSRNSLFSIKRSPESSHVPFRVDPRQSYWLVYFSIIQWSIGRSALLALPRWPAVMIGPQAGACFK
jgi:hypothetical protein